MTSPIPPESDSDSQRFHKAVKSILSAQPIAPKVKVKAEKKSHPPAEKGRKPR